MASTLTSASTTAAVYASYLDNASWEEDGDVVKAKAFITAARFLRGKGITRIRHGSSEVEIDLKAIGEELAAARAYLARSSGVLAGGGGIKFLSVRDFRS